VKLAINRVLNHRPCYADRFSRQIKANASTKFNLFLGNKAHCRLSTPSTFRVKVGVQIIGPKGREAGQRNPSDVVPRVVQRLKIGWRLARNSL
jgi:hypothetical protein